VFPASSLVRALAADLVLESDAALLARYAGARDEAAFAALFSRHGPMVRAVCRRHCRDPHLADDAEQGVWLVLARRAGAVSRPDRLANWLFGVAARVARKAAASAARVVPPRAAEAVPAASVSVAAEELLRVLDEELAALPEDERLPLVLCFLEGQTQDEAARTCGTCVRTLRRRLDRGRAALRKRLERRGVAPAAAFAALAVAPTVAGAMPSVLAVALGCGPVPSSLPPWITEELTMTSTTWWVRVVVAAGLGLGTAAAVTGVWMSDPRPAPPADPALGQRAKEPAPADLPKGAVARLGSPAFRYPGEGVPELGFSPDGKQLVAIGSAGVSVWTVPDGRTLVAATNEEKKDRELFVIGPDGRFAVDLVDHRDAEKQQAFNVRVTDLKTGRVAGTFPATYDTKQVEWWYARAGAISPDGSTLAVQNGKEASLYALPDGNLLRRWTDDNRIFRNVAFTPDGKHLVVGSNDELTLTVWDVATGTKRKTLSGDGSGTGVLSVSPDGKTVVAAVNKSERKQDPKDPGGFPFVRDVPSAEFVVWDLATGELVRRVATELPVPAVRCLSDGTAVGVVVSSHQYKPPQLSLRRWRLSDGKVLWSAVTDTRRFAVSSDGKLLAVPWETGAIALWDVATGTARPRTGGHVKIVQSVAFAADGKTIRTTDGTELRTWDAATGRPTGRFNHPELIGTARWDGAGRIVAAVPRWTDDRQTIAVFDAVADKKLLTLPDPAWSFDGVDLSADGTRLCVGVTRGKVSRVQLWDVAAAKQLWDVPLPVDWSLDQGVVLTADGRVLIGTTDLIVLDAKTGKQLDRWDLLASDVLPKGKSSRLLGLYSTRDGRTLGLVIPEVGIYLVDSRTGKRIRRIETTGEDHRPLAFSPDGSRFATGTLSTTDDAKNCVYTDTGIRVWETATGKLLERLDGAPARVNALAFSPDGRRLVTGHFDGTALVWAVPKGQ